MDTPHFEHDCTACTFLGTYAYHGAACDLYHCTQGDTCPTVIARYSSEPSDYTSGMPFADTTLPTFHPLKVAKQFAITRGLKVPTSH